MVPKWPVNYSVPNFGVDAEILSTHASIASSEATLGQSLSTSWKKPDEPKRNYFIPNFGVDKDIKLTQ